MQVQQPPQPGVHTHRKKLTGRTKLALWLMIGPTVLIALTLTLLALVNFTANPNLLPEPDATTFVATPTWVTIINAITLLTGVISVITWLPGIIIGAVLLSKKPKNV